MSLTFASTIREQKQIHERERTTYNAKRGREQLREQVRRKWRHSSRKAWSTAANLSKGLEENIWLFF